MPCCHPGGSGIGDRGRTREGRRADTLDGMTTTPETTHRTDTDPTDTDPTGTGRTDGDPTTTARADDVRRGTDEADADRADIDAGRTGTDPAASARPTVGVVVTDPIATAVPQRRTIPPGDDAVLASDSEREHVTDRIREAAAEGRLTLDEADERQAAAYAARTRADLVPLLAGLPTPPRPRRPRRGPLTPRARRILGVHVGVTAAVLLFLLTAAVFGPAPLFMPIGPAFWLGLILFVHSRRAEREPSPDDAVQDELR